MKSPSGLANAIEQLKQGELDAAEAGLRAVLANDPEQAQALHYMGVLTHRRGDADAGVQLIRHALTLDPKMPDAHNNLGNILRLAGDEEGAAQAYFEALKLNPHFADSWCNLAVLLRNLGNLPEAVEMLGYAVHFNPDHAESWHNLGINLANLGQIEKAAEALQRCAETAGDSKWYPPGMHAYILAKLGQKEAAKEILIRYLERNPGHETARHMLAALRGENLARASEDYVRDHFDGFARSFDSVLKSLDYRAPFIVTEAVRVVKGDGPAFTHVVDLGCGTGLCGALIRKACVELVGVDLSPGMLRRAADRGVYDRLVEAELGAYLLDQPADSCDLAVCVDTLCYIGELTPVFAGLRHALRPGASFVATVEAQDAAEPGYTLTLSGRYTHAESYLRAEAEAAGLAVAALEQVVLRNEMGAPVGGFVLTLRA